MKIPLSIFLLFAMASYIPAMGQNDDYEKRQNEQAKAMFEHCDEGKYTRYTGPIEVNQTDDYVYYETDSIRVYLSPYFYYGFLSNNDTTAVEIFKYFGEEYGKLFEKGLLTGKMFVCELSDSCKYISESGWKVQQGDTFVPYQPELFGYTGPTIKILNIEPRWKINTKTTRRFEIWATSSKMEDGWGSFPVFYLELTNREATEKTDLKDFIDGAVISCFRYGYTQL
jgi:hypothetical protein